jgi:serine/threonine protein kinase
MELLTGRDLSLVIRDEFPLPLPRIIRIMSQVFSALDEAHAQGVIHRDLKPSNIMLIERRGEPDFVKVCDYGIAKSPLGEDQGDAQMLTIQGLVCGTPEYMSPEQARGELLDGRADLYSAAVILYQLVTGDIPFRAATPIEIISRHLSEAPIVPSARRLDPAIPATVDDLILRGLAKSRELRPATAALFREELQSISSGKAGRRTRGAQDTLPSVPVQIGGDGTTSSHRIPARNVGRSGKPWAIGIVVSAVFAGVTMAALRGRRPKSITATQIAVTSSRREANGTGDPNGTPPPTPRPNDNKQATVPPVVSRGNQTLEDVTTQAAPTPNGDRPVESLAARQPGKSRRPAPTALRDSVEARGIESPDTGTAVSRLPVLTPVASTPAIGPPTVDGVLSAPGPTGARTWHEAIGQAESLLSQGEVEGACRRGEEAKKAAPREAAPYRFLGKCYMRAGDPGRAKENYRRYLDLAPDARDAMFIESIVK